MVMMRRGLTYRSDTGDLAVPVTIHAPLKGEHDWSCAYEIGWPDGTHRGHGYGIDATQAMLLALKAIGADIYTSDFHRAGRLRWLEQGDGYGFPVPSAIRHLLIGGDAEAEG